MRLEAIVLWEWGLALDDGTVEIEGMNMNHSIAAGESWTWLRPWLELKELLAIRRLCRIQERRIRPMMIDIEDDRGDLYLPLAADWDPR